MADATADQIKFAQSRINYFEEVLNKGANDKLKTLVKVTGKTKADEIAAEIKGAQDITQAMVDQAKKDAAAAEQTLDTDIEKVRTELNTVKGNVDGLVTGIGAAQTEVDKITSDSDTSGKLKDTKTKLGYANDYATDAKTKLEEVNIDEIRKKKGDALKTAIIDAQNKIKDALGKINGVKGVKENLGYANDDLKNVKKPNGNDPVDIPAELGKAQNDATAAENAFGDDSSGLVGSIKTAEKDYTAYSDKKQIADTIKVGTSPIVTAAEDACPNIGDTKKADEAQVTKCFADGFEKYDFINALLKNIPNTGKDVLNQD